MPRRGTVSSASPSTPPRSPTAQRHAPSHSSPPVKVTRPSRFDFEEGDEEGREGDEDEDGDGDVDVEGDEDARRSATVAEGIAEIEVGVTLMTLCAVGALSTALPIVQKYRYKS